MKGKYNSIMQKTKSLGLNAILNSLQSLLNLIFPLITFPYISRTLSVDGVGKPRITRLQYSSLNNYVEVWYYDLDNPSGYRPVSTKNAKIEDLVSPL